MVIFESRLENKIDKLIIKRVIRCTIPAQSASVSPPLGPLLGQFGINIVDFCKRFNEQSKIYSVEVMVNTEIILFENKVFEILLKLPSISFLVNESFKDLTYEKDLPNEIELSKFYEIVRFRSFLTSKKEYEYAKMVRGSLRSYGLIINNDIKTKI